MAKIEIHIEDLPNNKVKIVCVPPLEQMIHMEISGNTLTSAQGYAFKILNEIRKESKANGPTLIDIPRVRISN